MNKIIWEIQCHSSLPAYRYCKKCGEKRAFTCSGQFRVNAQQKHLDVWLIYKCPDCDTTWNASVCCRVSPQSIAPELLDGFYRNDGALAWQYAMDSDFLGRNGAQAGLPQYSIAGDSFSVNESTELEIISRYSFPARVSALVREKLLLSRKEFDRLVTDGTLRSSPPQDLLKCRLRSGILLRFH